MKITMVEKERFELEFRNDKGYEFITGDRTYEYGIRNFVSNEIDSEGEFITEKHVVMYNRCKAYQGIQDMGTISEFRDYLKELSIEIENMDDELDL